MRSGTVRSALLVIVLAAATASPALAGPAPRQMASVGADAAVLPAAEPAGTKVVGDRSGWVDLRDSAALVLVGTMLIGLAAAVRRTA